VLPLAATVTTDTFVIGQVEVSRVPLGDVQLAMDAVGIPAKEIE